MENVSDAPKLRKEDNPFSKIEYSTLRIRTLVNSFAVCDQEFLISLMEILDDDSTFENLDHQNMMMEAKFRLANLIDEHAGNSDVQSKLLDSLKYWFFFTFSFSNSRTF